MGRDYAGVLGPLAMFVVLVRGLTAGSGVEATLLAATVALVGFAVLGFVLGTVANQIIDDSVRAQLTAQLEALEQDRSR